MLLRYSTLFLALAGVLAAQAQTVYVSASAGLEQNDGRDAAHPMRDVAQAVKRGSEILLQAGDTFYVGNLKLSGKKLSRFGKGRNPIICGYRRIVEPRWTEVERNIWRLCLTEDNFTGIILHGSSASNNLCAFHDYERDVLHGRKVWHKEEMAADWDFWQTDTLKGASPAAYDYVYLYLTTDPNRLKLEMSVYDCALRVDHSTVDGVDFVGFGFGISAKSQTQIRNCRVDAIGGRIIPEGKSYVCYGNGIEFWITKGLADCVAENNVFSRCYDCGCTIQGRVDSPRNIRIRNNVVIDCCQGWEDFLTDPDSTRIFRDCVFENNIVINSGHTTGFGYAKTRFKYCHVLSGNSRGNKGMVLRNNTFVGGNYFCSAAFQGQYRSTIWQGNTCVIKRGDYLLGNYMGTKDVIRVPTEKGVFRTLAEATQDAIRRYRALTGDQTTIFTIKSEAYINKRVERLKKKYLK